MNALAKQTQAEIVTADGATLMAVIGRAASDPATDVAKLASLMDLYERISARQGAGAYAAALATMQPDLPVIDQKGAIRNKGGDVQSTYAKWEDINDAIKPILATHGFSLSFRIKSEPDRVHVTAVLAHRDGHSEETTFGLPIDGSGSKNNVQGFGSSVSYGKRYTAGALLNLTSRGEDDDGRLAGETGAKISEKDVENLIALADVAGADKAKFCKFFGVPSIADIPQRRLKEATDALERKRTAKVVQP